MTIYLESRDSSLYYNVKNILFFDKLRSKQSPSKYVHFERKKMPSLFQCIDFNVEKNDEGKF